MKLAILTALGFGLEECVRFCLPMYAGDYLQVFYFIFFSLNDDTFQIGV